MPVVRVRDRRYALGGAGNVAQNVCAVGARCDLVATVGALPDSDVRMISLEPPGPYSRTILPAMHARDSATLIALKLNGEVLDLDHGYPCRLIAPTRPGVLQTKWLSRIEVVQ